MTDERLKEVLRLHEMHLFNKPGGVCADLRTCDLSGMDLSDAMLRGANLSGADLTRADLRGANLRDADLKLADMSWANLKYADLRDARLHGADLFGALNIKCAGPIGRDGEFLYGVLHSNGVMYKIRRSWGDEKFFLDVVLGRAPLGRVRELEIMEYDLKVQLSESMADGMYIMEFMHAFAFLKNCLEG